MKSIRSEFLISYDIEDNKIRTKFHKQLSTYGLRSVQKSVFWGYLNRAEVTALSRFIITSLNKTDKAFIIPTKIEKIPRKWLFGYQEDDFKDWLEFDCI